MSISTIILAAGYGTRMRSKTPKVLHTISGKPMIIHTIEEAKKISDDITVVLYFEYQKIQEVIKSYFDDINFVIQDVQNYPGTGGAIRNITTKHEDVVILNGDMPLITSASLEPILQTKSDIALSVIDAKDPSGYGRVSIEDGSIKRIIEQKDCDQKQLQIKTVNAGVYKLTRTVLHEYIPKLSNDNAAKEYYLTDIIEMGVQNGLDIKPAYVDEQFFKGVNSKYDLAIAEDMMQDRIKKGWMQAGVIMRLTQTIYIEKDVVFEGECEIENGVSLRGKTYVENSHIKANSTITDADIVSSSIGPLAHIRPNATIKNSHIGNFVEVKNSQLEGVKAGHLSYLGDSTISSGSNIGAGVITCNYDGKKKHKTVIGKDVFVGSDTQIVAPVTIEDESIIAAGTTLTQDVSKGELAISRTPIKRVKNFFYKFFQK